MQQTDMIAEQDVGIAQEDRLRAGLYDYLALILSRPPDADLLQKTAALTGGDGDIGPAVNALARLAKMTTATSAEKEFNRLFIGLGRGELLPYASYYLTGFLNEKPLALLRRDMLALGIARAENIFEPEDNISSLMEMMAALITGRHAAPADLEAQKSFFNKHIGPWAKFFFADLEAAKNSIFYAPVGSLGRTFMEIEAESFRLG